MMITEHHKFNMIGAFNTSPAGGYILFAYCFTHKGQKKACPKTGGDAVPIVNQKKIGNFLNCRISLI
ncbi:hypothetical protein I5M32_13035 [Pedobacter sp. SD-b]|uniref:Uncharacterized protein n=1 Tax=Pedobacter segetis TaxID=2793069 RepID=A0ABS1BMB3_9SPHI|nr:hypothetical protein [Pedobacter segetis]MBK0383886.1 hypothetical protein [Pedobacter segetis]